jgi:hypothetical protein
MTGSGEMTESAVVGGSDLDFDPFAEEMIWDPYPRYRLLRRLAPVHFNKTRGSGLLRGITTVARS